MAAEPLRFPAGRPPGGGGGSDGVDVRLGKLEVDVDYIKRDLRDLKTDFGELRRQFGVMDGNLTTVQINLATLTERVNHLPTKSYIFATTLGMISFFTAVLLFADKIRAALHIQP